MRAGAAPRNRPASVLRDYRLPRDYINLRAATDRPLNVDRVADRRDIIRGEVQNDLAGAIGENPLLRIAVERGAADILLVGSLALSGRVRS